MSPPPPFDAALPAPALGVPQYLDQTYWWAYVHPNAVSTFEREWLVNLILFGNYARLRDAALADLGAAVEGRTLQVACVYGNLTPKLRERLAPDASLDVVDILPIQLRNLAAKLPRDQRVALLHGDSAALACPDASYDQVLLFFLLHEQPEAVRRATLAEAVRVLRPGGRIVVVDYHRPRPWHPLKLLMTGIFRKLEPFASDLWAHEVSEFLPAGARVELRSKHTYFGGLYQKLVLVK
ncbi:rhodoquinone biosynthesis methyltransferase RquA [Ramlibacter albus]|uniref:Class I SAM-dependent methyltransferase n=1 Tax=Ramlibacter albus TaxID=2079448 RepID=A0A923S303_9BURK|nr:rhodoquinone biosynthesis methyltransferase RquA [Ramlibacter albus]MBC5766024.1 class I SAM-dependent methyltransferase [Ramlibacter albus]